MIKHAINMTTLRDVLAGAHVCEHVGACVRVCVGGGGANRL